MQMNKLEFKKIITFLLQKKLMRRPFTLIKPSKTWGRYLFIFTQYMQIYQTTCFCYCISKTKKRGRTKSGRKNYIDRARSIY